MQHPPSSPATLERRRAAREQRRQQQQNRRNEMAALEETASNINAAAVEAAERELSGDTNEDDTSNKAKEDSDDPKDKEEEDSKPKPLSEEELKAKKEKEIEEKSAAEATKLLQTVKDTLISTCLNIIESSDTSNVSLANSDELTTKQSEDVVNDLSSCVIIMANFLLGVSKSYPDLESNIATKLLERLKGKVDVKSPSVSLQFIVYHVSLRYLSFSWSCLSNVNSHYSFS